MSDKNQGNENLIEEQKKEITITKPKRISIFIILLIATCAAASTMTIYKSKRTIIKNEMKPTPFKQILQECLDEYKESKSLFGVPVVKNEFKIPIGPAAGPQTQLTGNLLAAYAAGASVFDLKTVQIMTGDELGIIKPCIYVGSEVYNTEWSTELTVPEAMGEYIKAAIIIQVLSREFGLTPFEDLQFVMSVGYDLKGIKSKSVDDFIEGLKWAESTDFWKNAINDIKEMESQFKNFKISDIEKFKKDICNTVTLSTMHGCPAEDIEQIGKYLLKEKKLNTYIKMNPTLLGQNKLKELLSGKQYNVDVPNAVFKSDINLEQAYSIIENCMKTAKEEGLLFGVKLTNTLPSTIHNNELAGQQMYMSGPALYAISINVAKLIATKFGGKIPISYSGGIDDKNIKEVIETGIAPLTLSSYLLKPNGYKNLSKLLVKANIPKIIDLVKLSALAENAIKDPKYNKVEAKVYKKRENYSSTCAMCHNCENVCPNRANRRIKIDGKDIVLHDPTLCNECGACVYSCVMGHKPYLEKASKFEFVEKTDEIFYHLGLIFGIVCLIYVLSKPDRKMLIICSMICAGMCLCSLKLIKNKCVINIVFLLTGFFTSAINITALLQISRFGCNKCKGILLSCFFLFIGLSYCELKLFKDITDETKYLINGIILTVSGLILIIFNKEYFSADLTLKKDDIFEKKPYITDSLSNILVSTLSDKVFLFALCSITILLTCIGAFYAQDNTRCHLCGPALGLIMVIICNFFKKIDVPCKMFILYICAAVFGNIIPFQEKIFGTLFLTFGFASASYIILMFVDQQKNGKLEMGITFGYLVSVLLGFEPSRFIYYFLKNKFHTYALDYLMKYIIIGIIFAYLLFKSCCCNKKKEEGQKEKGNEGTELEVSN